MHSAFNIFRSLLQKVWLQLAVRFRFYNPLSTTQTFSTLRKSALASMVARQKSNRTIDWFETCEVTLWLPINWPCDFDHLRDTFS